MNAIAETARQNAMQIEAKKDGLSQMQSGEWTLRLKLHADEIPTPLLKATMGTRYMLAMVEIGDNEEPMQQEQPKGKSYAQQAALTCKEPAFWKFCSEFVRSGNAVLNEEDAVRFIYGNVGISSRSELVEGTPAGDSWHRLWLDYKNWLKS